jgi:polysaccharide pyruvyl transferase WcaK-like protein
MAPRSILRKKLQNIDAWFSEAVAAGEKFAAEAAPLRSLQRFVPASVRRNVELHLWRKPLIQLPRKPCRYTAQRLLIVPSDPKRLAGSRGDAAMIEVVIQHYLERCRNLDVAIITAPGAAAHDIPARRIEAWRSPFSYEEIVDALSSFSPDTVIIVGADAMDGWYSLVQSMRLLLIADLAARMGARTSVLGFSFNAQPAPELKQVFEILEPRVTLNIRDAISLERFKLFCTASARIVADAAFLLNPVLDSQRIQPVAEWISGRRAVGRAIVAFNLHPNFFRNATTKQVNALVDSSAAVLVSVAKEKSVSWLLLPHDYRGPDGDGVCLAPLARRLRRELKDDVYYCVDELSAAELKGITGRLDAVFTGRMHLAIASLGSGIPVMAVEWQDKVAGLLRHFDLPDWLLLSPYDVMAPASLEKAIMRFVDELELLQLRVRAWLPDVMRAARCNFDPATHAGSDFAANELPLLMRPGTLS